MNERDPVNLYLPTLIRAKEAGLLPDWALPLQEVHFAALVVQASLMRRRTWTEEKSLPPHMLASIPQGAPPVPTQFEVINYLRLDERVEVACKACVELPGYRRCRICGGSGVIGTKKRPCSCNNGYVKCPNCEGTAISSQVRLRYYSDEPGWMAELYMPTELVHVPAFFKLESTLEGAVGVSNVLPECLRCHDLSERSGGSAYRGGEKKIKPDFRGYDFSDTIDKALSGLRAFGAGMQVVHYDIKAYAWPLLWLSYPRDLHIALYVSPSGELLKFEGTNP